MVGVNETPKNCSISTVLTSFIEGEYMGDTNLTSPLSCSCTHHLEQSDSPLHLECLTISLLSSSEHKYHQLIGISTYFQSSFHLNLTYIKIFSVG